MSKMKLFKLIVHQKNFSGEDLIINPKDFPAIKKGDIVEIYHAEDEFSRLLLQVTSFKEDLQGRETISIEQSIASAFQLRTYADVCMNIVNPNDVALDSVELTFKDQYLSRSDMWRLKTSLVNTCVYLNKKVEFCGGSIRCQVYEMWSSGERVACGVITEDTKVVFRSSTSMVYLFIQMSSEMWDFDIHGDLYFEKAVNGFLTELLQKWKKTGSNHEVTIVLFSRTFYKATSLDEFPGYMRECLQQDYKGRFYEDFYRVAVQNERYDDWANSLVQLRRLFAVYQEMVLDYHARPGVQIPKAFNSTAAQGNFLEVLNMSLNVFEKHYLDRSFDRTGQLSIVVTPGVGVFEVDRELTNVTKQRVIDNGVGSDLVCVGEQPLHAVPLFKFHNKDTSVNAVDDYSMPHWINLSFYSSNKKVGYSTFIPRIKLPSRNSLQNTSSRRSSQAVVTTKGNDRADEDEAGRLPNAPFDYDAYDAKVFQLPSMHTASRFPGHKKVSTGTINEPYSSILAAGRPPSKRKMSDPDVHHIQSLSPVAGTNARSAAISIPSRSNESSPQASYSAVHDAKSLARTIQENASPTGPGRTIVGSVGSPSTAAGPMQAMRVRPGRALINPFDPSHVTIKLTSNRRRWTHIFPKGPTGVLIQQHHYQAVPAKPAAIDQSYEPPENGAQSTNPLPATLNAMECISESDLFYDRSARGSLTHEMPSLNIHSGRHPGNGTNKTMTLLWGATGEQEWTPALTTGVDWKSLTIPACLPITTDFFPDKRSLQNDYVVSDYNLLPDDVNADYAQQRAVYKKPLTTAEVFREIISQRLSQGFQLIVLPANSRNARASSTDPPPTTSNQQLTLPSNSAPSAPGSALARSRSRGTTDASEPSEEYLLSIGRIFHKIALHGSSITVTRYRPRHPYPPFNIHYRYRFHAPHHSTYEVSWVSFTTEKLENYNWNYIDHYICTRGDTDFVLVEALKYWRFRVYLLPGSHAGTRKILDGSEHFDAYTPQSADEQGCLTEGFLRFLETWVNKIKRPNCHKKPRASVVGSSPFRERLGSNRAMERPRSRSGSKVMERVKTEGSSGRVSPASEASIEQASIDSTHHSEAMEDSPNSTDFKRLSASATFTEMLEGMKNANTGLGFLTHPNLPPFTFSSADAVQWLLTHVEGLSQCNQAAEIMQNMLKENLIRHSSKYPSKDFVVGFHLYYIFDEKDAKGAEGALEDFQSFENEWIEVEIRRPLGWKHVDLVSPTTLPVSNFLADALDHQLCGQEAFDWKQPAYKHTHLEIDVSNKSDRIEWGHARYQPAYQADRAYELVVQWVAATGSLVADLVLGWARKAQACGLHMVPIPADPFALPFTLKSDPLRGPIFIPLDTESLMGDKSYLFEEFPEDSWNRRLFLLQDAIVARFGFVACVLETPPAPPTTQPPPLAGDAPHPSPVITSMPVHNSPNSPFHRQYVHLTGNAFIMIPTQTCCQHQGSSIKIRPAPASYPMTASTRRYPVHDTPISSPHEEYITRHVSGRGKEETPDTRIGFLWSWNHMIGRRWKSGSNPATGDESFQTRFLRDFQAFCANQDNRLKNFWDICWTQKLENSSVAV